MSAQGDGMRRGVGRWGKVIAVATTLAVSLVPAITALADLGDPPPPETHYPAGSGLLQGTELVEEQDGFPCFRATRTLFGLRGTGTFEGRTGASDRVVYSAQINAGQTLYGDGPLQVQLENTEPYYHSPFGTHGTETGGGAGCSPTTAGSPVPAAFRIFAAEGTQDTDGDNDVDVLTGAAWVYRLNDAGDKVPCVGQGSFARGNADNAAVWPAEWTLSADCVVVGNGAGTPGTGTAPRGTFMTDHGTHAPCFEPPCVDNLRVDYRQYLPKPGPFLRLTGPGSASVGCEGPVTVTARLTDTGWPAADAPVTFSVAGPGPAVPPGGAANTDQKGQAAFSFTAASTGDYTVTATATLDGQQVSATHAVHFGDPPPLSVAAGGPGTWQTEEPLTVTATVNDACGPLPGAQVEFTVAWPAQDRPWTGQATPGSGSALTGADGQATFSFSGDRAGDYRVTATTRLPTGEQASAARTVHLEIRDFKRVGAVTLANAESTERELVSAVLDPAGDYAYFGTGSGEVVKVDLATFQRVGAIGLQRPDGGEGALRSSAVIDPAGRYAYFAGVGPFAAGDLIYKIDLATFELVGTLVLEPGEDFLQSGVIDPAGRLAYFGTTRRPGRIVKVDLTTLTRVGAIDTRIGDQDLGEPYTGVMDPAGRYAYFGTSDFSSGWMVKVDLANFQITHTIILPSQVVRPVSAVIDPAGDFAYVGAQGRPGRVVKIDLRRFQQVGAITHGAGENLTGDSSAVIDPTGDFAYFGAWQGRDTTQTMLPAVVVKVDLRTFERVHAVTLEPGPSGEDNLTSAVIDPRGGYAYFGTATENFTVPLNRPPDRVVKVMLTRPSNPALVAGDDSYATTAGTMLTVVRPGVLGNDDDTTTSQDRLAAGQASDPAGGSVALNGDGSFTYTPDPGFVGTDTFTYTATNGMDYSAPATVSVAVAPPQGVTGRAFGYHASDMSLFGGAQPDTGPTPAVTLAPDASNSPQTATATTGRVAYGPATLFSSNQIDVATSGSLGGGGSVTSSANINDLNTSRVEIFGEDNYDCCDANGESYPTTTPRPLTDVASTCSASGTGARASTTISNGWLYLDSGWSDGDATYPESAADAGGLAEHDPVKVAVANNPAPGTTYTGHIHLSADSTDDYKVVFNEQTTNPDGSLTVNAVHEYLGTNPPDVLTGDLILGQAVCGTPAGSGTNAAPDAVGDAYVTDEDTPTAVMAPGVLGNDVDPDGDALSASVATGPAHGTVALSADGSFTYTPNANYNGPDAFTYTASDGNGGSDTATVALTVNPLNDAPVAGNDAYATARRMTLAVGAPGVLANDVDPDGDALTAGSPSAPAGGNVTLNPDGSFTYTPARNFTGTDTFTYTASDDNGGTATATVTITVGGSSPPPPSGPDLSITMSDSPDPATVGTNVTYTMVVANAGPGAASGVSVLFSPSGSSYVSASGGTCTVVKGKQSGVRCDLGDMAAGTTRTLGVVVQAPARATTVSGTATVSSASSDPTTSNNTVTESTTVTR